MGDSVQLVDSGAEAVSEVSMLLDYYDISADATDKGKTINFSQQVLKNYLKTLHMTGYQ